ncbi:MAG: hypothetical protein PHX85_02445, partial [Methanobacteriaceae archaeon]|nr:hypothetical protein [Methanobacteriaceae archaeon]
MNVKNNKKLEFKKNNLRVANIIIVLTVLFIGIFISFCNYNIDKKHSNLLVSRNEKFVQIEKYHFHDDKNPFSKDLIEMSNEDVSYINQKLPQTTHQIYKLINKLGSYSTIYETLNIKMEHGLFYDAYTYFYDEVDIVAVNKFINHFFENVIGRLPTDSSEILISNHLADLIITAGIIPYNDNPHAKNNYYKPNSYEELINSDKYFYFGNSNRIKIVGIINYDLSKYQSLKNKNWDELSKQEKDASNELIRKMKNIHNKIYVNNSFIDNLKTSDFNYKYELTLNNQKLENDFVANISVLNKEIEYFDGVNWKKAKKLHKNQMLLNINYFNDYIKKNKNGSSSKLKQDFFLDYVNIIGKKVMLQETHLIKDDINKLREDIFYYLHIHQKEYLKPSLHKFEEVKHLENL